MGRPKETDQIAVWASFTAEQRLLVAMLRQAVADLAGVNCTCEPRLRHLARAWLESDSQDLGSYRWICDSLELDASWLRRKLFEMAASCERSRTARKTVVSIDPLLRRPAENPVPMTEVERDRPAVSPGLPLSAFSLPVPGVYPPVP